MTASHAALGSQGQRLDADRLVLAVVLKPGLWQQRSRARRPDRGRGEDPGHIAHAQRGDRRSQLGVVAVTGIHQHDPLRQTRRARCLDLLERDLIRYLGLAAEVLILRPILRKIDPISHSKGGLTVGRRRRHRHLTVILLTQLAAILAGDPRPSAPVLGKPRIVG